MRWWDQGSVLNLTCANQCLYSFRRHNAGWQTLWRCTRLPLTWCWWINPIQPPNFWSKATYHSMYSPSSGLGYYNFGTHHTRSPWHFLPMFWPSGRYDNRHSLRNLCGWHVQFLHVLPTHSARSLKIRPYSYRRGYDRESTICSKIFIKAHTNSSPIHYDTIMAVCIRLSFSLPLSYSCFLLSTIKFIRTLHLETPDPSLVGNWLEHVWRNVCEEHTKIQRMEDEYARSPVHYPKQLWCYVNWMVWLIILSLGIKYEN